MVLPHVVAPLRLPTDSAVDSAEHGQSARRGEFALIEQYFKNLTDQDGVLLGIGDDAALVNATGGPHSDLVVATDSLLQSVHFPAIASAYDIGRRTLSVNLSDFAAMGATPRWFTLALSLPVETANSEWLEQLSAGLAEVANRAGCALIGGDTTCGALALTVTLIGEVPTGQALRRDGAREPPELRLRAADRRAGEPGERAAGRLFGELHLLADNSKLAVEGREPVVGCHGWPCRAPVSLCV